LAPVSEPVEVPAWDAPYDEDAFVALQGRLAGIWPAMTVRGTSHARTLVVLSSISLKVPDQILPLFPAYEERYLAYVLSLAQSPATTVIYVTSLPISTRQLDYFLGLIPGLDVDDVRRRLICVSVGDPAPIPLTQKILHRPRLIERIRRLIPTPERAVLLPFVTSSLEADLALQLGVPAYGPAPALRHYGTKRGSRELFVATGVPHPVGVDVRTVDELVEGLREIVRTRDPEGAIAKLDEAVSGLGNALIDLRGAGDDPAELRRRVAAMRPEDDDLDVPAFLALLEADGGIVEERLAGTEFASPSVQLRASPMGGVEVLSTHDQILGGAGGQTYFGCRFPADPAYAADLSRHGMEVGEELARRGAVGRFSVDFVATRTDGPWDLQAVEVNLRNGGTTHPTLTLLGLTNGEYLADEGRFEADGRPKCYVATDHLEPPELDRLTPDDVIDLVEEHGLAWDPETQTGVVLHMMSAVASAGRVGLTAIADTQADADALYARVEQVLHAAGTGAPIPPDPRVP
jgi:hypothetical protein